jgi:hypothetical protein
MRIERAGHAFVRSMNAASSPRRRSCAPCPERSGTPVKRGDPQAIAGCHAQGLMGTAGAACLRGGGAEDRARPHGGRAAGQCTNL